MLVVCWARRLGVLEEYQGRDSIYRYCSFLPCPLLMECPSLPDAHKCYLRATGFVAFSIELLEPLPNRPVRIRPNMLYKCKIGQRVLYT